MVVVVITGGKLDDTIELMKVIKLIIVPETNKCGHIP